VLFFALPCSGGPLAIALPCHRAHPSSSASLRLATQAGTAIASEIMLASAASNLSAMPTYELHYAKDHLFELFDEARSGVEVIIVRADGRSCELTPLAEVKQDKPMAAALKVPDEVPDSGELVPA
jgi:hypothetical protein